MGSMERQGILRVILSAAFIAAVCAPLPAQTEVGENGSASHLKIKQVPQAVPPKPFSAGSKTTVAPVEFRSVDQMAEKDRELVADAESSISEHAGFMGLEFNQGKWSYQQVVCPALPNHIFLRFMRNNGTGDVSTFSASIPTNGEGRVRIIPILLRGYSLFSPAPINALTISAFNHIRAEEHDEGASGWLGTGLCYAALAGGHPLAAKLTEDPGDLKFQGAIPAELEIPLHRDEVISFADVGAAPRLMQWTMTFTAKGRLIKATHSPVRLLQESAVPSAGPIKGLPVPPTIVNLPGEPVPQAQLKNDTVPDN